MDILGRVRDLIEAKDADGLKSLTTADLISLERVTPTTVGEAVAKKLPMDTAALAFVPYIPASSPCEE